MLCLRALLAALVLRIRRRVLRLLRKRGLSPEELDEDALRSEGGLLPGWQAAALAGRIAVGPRAGWRVLRIGAEQVPVPPIGQGLCAHADGFDLHAGVHVPAEQRHRLESLCRYMLRPPFAKDRLKELPDGRVQV